MDGILQRQKPHQRSLRFCNSALVQTSKNKLTQSVNRMNRYDLQPTWFALSVFWMLVRVREVTMSKSSCVYSFSKFLSLGTLFSSRHGIQGLNCIFLVTVFCSASSMSFAAYSAVVLSAVMRRMLCGWWISRRAFRVSLILRSIVSLSMLVSARSKSLVMCTHTPCSKQGEMPRLHRNLNLSRRFDFF